MINTIYYKNTGWAYVTRIYDPVTHAIESVEKEGFVSEEKAKKQLEIDMEKYEQDRKILRTMTNVQFTFTEYLIFWFNNIFVTREKTSTKVVAAYAIKSLILPNVKKDMALWFLTADYLNEIIKKCMDMSSCSGFTARKILRNLMNDALLYGYIKNDLASQLISVPEPNKKYELLNHQEIKKLLSEAKSYPAYAFEIYLALFAGLREAEILGLKYTDFDEEHQTLTIERQYTRAYAVDKLTEDGYEVSSGMVTKAPKAGSERLLKIPPFLFEELKKKKEFNDQIIRKAKVKGLKELPDEYVSISVYGDRKKTSSLTPALKRICKKAGLKPLKGMHMLRHCFATLLIESGMELEEVSKCLGHKSVLTTFNTYVNIIEADAQAREYMEAFSPMPNVAMKGA